MKITEDGLRVAASDVASFLACQLLTQLDLRAARKELRPAREFDIGFQDLVRRGEDHERVVLERVVLERFRTEGHEVADLTDAAWTSCPAWTGSAGTRSRAPGSRPGCRRWTRTAALGTRRSGPSTGTGRSVRSKT